MGSSHRYSRMSRCCGAMRVLAPFRFATSVATCRDCDTTITWPYVCDWTFASHFVWQRNPPPDHFRQRLRQGIGHTRGVADRPGSSDIVNIDEPKACSEHAHKHLMTTTGLHFCFNCTRNIHKQAHCILPIKTDSLVAWILRCECDPRRPTNKCPNHFFAVNEPSAVPCFQYHKKTISSSF